MRARRGKRTLRRYCGRAGRSYAGWYLGATRETVDCVFRGVQLSESTQSCISASRMRLVTPVYGSVPQGRHGSAESERFGQSCHVLVPTPEGDAREQEHGGKTDQWVIRVTSFPGSFISRPGDKRAWERGYDLWGASSSVCRAYFWPGAACSKPDLDNPGWAKLHHWNASTCFCVNPVEDSTRLVCHNVPLCPLEYPSDDWARPIFGVTANFKSLSREEREKRDYQNMSKRRRLRWVDAHPHPNWHRANTLFSAVRSPRFWVSGYCTKWRIQGSFDSSSSRSLNVKTWPRNSILSIDTYRYVSSMHLPQHKLCTTKTVLALEVNFFSTFTEFTWPWRRTLTNWNDVKYVVPRCHPNCPRSPFYWLFFCPQIWHIYFPKSSPQPLWW